MLDADGLAVPELPTLSRALALYGKVPRLDFADAYVAACALERGPPAVASFDADFDRVTGVRRVTS